MVNKTSGGKGKLTERHFGDKNSFKVYTYLNEYPKDYTRHPVKQIGFDKYYLEL